MHNDQEQLNDKHDPITYVTTTVATVRFTDDGTTRVCAVSVDLVSANQVSRVDLFRGVIGHDLPVFGVKRVERYAHVGVVEETVIVIHTCVCHRDDLCGVIVYRCISVCVE